MTMYPRVSYPFLGSSFSDRLAAWRQYTGVPSEMRVDYRIHSPLAVRIALYWMTCLAAITAILLVWHVVAVPGESIAAHLASIARVYGPAAIASLLLLPAVIFDLVRLSSVDCTGPMIRLRRSLHDLAQGRPVAAVRFRHADFWEEFADDFNTVAVRSARDDRVEQRRR